MIISSPEPLEIGTIGTGCSGGDGVWYPEQRYLILRSATREEWIAEHPDGVMGMFAFYFYEVSMD